MNQSAPRRPRHALAEPDGPPTDSPEATLSGDDLFSQEITRSLPVIPSQRTIPASETASPPAVSAPVVPSVTSASVVAPGSAAAWGPAAPSGPGVAAGSVAPSGSDVPSGVAVSGIAVPSGPVGAPAGLRPVPAVWPEPRPSRRRLLPAALAGATAVLLVAGVAVGIGGAAGTDMTDAPAVSSTP